MRSVLCALGLLLAGEGCDTLRNLPGLEPTPAAPLPPPPISMGPWLLDPVAGRMTVAWVTAEPVVGRVCARTYLIIRNFCHGIIVYLLKIETLTEYLAWQHTMIDI